MNKTISINISGLRFFVDEDAYAILRAYLDKIEASFKHAEGGDEIIKDIESRIAELFDARIQREHGVVNTAMVNEVISIMGSAEDMAGEETEQTSQSSSSSTVYVKPSKRFFRDIDNRILGGVCAGIAAYFNMDILLVRIIAVLLIPFTSGAIVLVYGVLWIALPPAISTAQKLEMRGRDITISNIEQSIRNEYDEVKKGFGKMKEKGETMYNQYRKKDNSTIILIAVILGGLFLWQFSHAGWHFMEAPFQAIKFASHGVYSGLAPVFSGIFFPGALPIILILLIVGLVFRSILKIVLYIIAFVFLGALAIKVIFWLFGSLLFFA